MNKTRPLAISSITNTILFGLYSILVVVRTGFYVREYGPSANGAIQVSAQIFMYLTLLESGFTSAYLYHMYKPFVSRQWDKLKGYHQGLTLAMRKVSLKMLIILVGISFIYPRFIEGGSVDAVYVGLVVLLTGIRSILPYFFSVATKNLLSVYNKKYIADIIDGVVDIATITLQIVLCGVFHWDILTILLSAILMYIIAIVAYRLAEARICVNMPIINVAALPVNKTMTNDIFVHKVSGLIYSSTDSVLLSILSTLNNVTVYGAYKMIISFPSQLIAKVADGVRPIMGKLLIMDKISAKAFYEQLLSVVYFVALVIGPLFFIFSSSFVSVWLGPQYTLNTISVAMLTCISVGSVILQIIYITRDGLGLYGLSKWFTLSQALVNLLLSIILLPIFGVTGIIAGSFVSMFFIAIPFNSRLVNISVFQKNLRVYRNTLLISFYSVAVGILAISIDGLMSSASGSLWGLVKNVVVVLPILGVMAFVVSIFNPHFKLLFKHFLCKMIVYGPKK